MDSEKEYPSVSVVIPVKNEAKKIRACIQGILSQLVPVNEIIVVDSGSTDGTQQILREFEKVQLVEIEPSSFNHGATRNLGVERTTGEFVILTVGDATPVDNLWISNLLAGFTDEQVAGVCGQQIVPHDRDKNPVEWFRPINKPAMKRYAFSPDEFLKLPAKERKQVCSWDDVTAMYRRSVLKKIPFRKITYGEDAIWAREAVVAGYAIVYNTAARVYHYHNVDKEFAFKRSLTTLYFRYKQFEYMPEPTRMNIKGWLSLINVIRISEPLSWKEKWHWLRYNLDQKKAMAKGYKLFYDALQKGEQALDEVHAKFCGKPPVPVK